mmetsp:Transcript_11105/g.20079  ORF Transcript_11105/g.20079 Transcript_11105/m.20079 type:complete len:273 (+) Transcript_11105:45-863(+)|eukprot:CAMPEP_0182445134 /NCGR_PEP_ID=MMETSP1172-20130603/3368_1 /TAXON_ID=708627 /ORGANISM="Timspurckia oligopyrenoides, Strain CCMP3278" /LENGTH=272 /DNA_ID=CAMNT_0024640847 /DNA_START=44 /DNA_END=862 /DNA_ORIENTATION=+
MQEFYGKAEVVKKQSSIQQNYWNSYNPQVQQQQQQQQQPVRQPHEIQNANSQSLLQTRKSSIHASKMNKQEVKLIENNLEMHQFTSMAALFESLKVAEHLERAWQKSAISEDEYTREMQKLIVQFKSTRDSIRDKVPDIDVFITDYRINVPAAYHRLVVVGVPATIQHGSTQVAKKEELGKVILDTTETFITALDCLNLNLTAVDKIQPLMVELVDKLNKFDHLGQYPGKQKMIQWLAKLNAMRAVDHLSDADTRQLVLDLRTALSEFRGRL